VTRAEQRLNSNHGRLIHAASAVPERLRSVPIPGWEWTPRDMLAHVLAWQQEALRHLRDPEAPWPAAGQGDAWNAASLRLLRDVGWDEVVARLEANHRELREHLAGMAEGPPRWFGPCTYWHYTEHTRALLAFLRSFGQSSTTTVAPIAAQS
jgi:hypothetical protein